METNIRRAGNASPKFTGQYEFSVYLDIRHLGTLCTEYLKGYGEEISENKLHHLVADLLLGVFSDTACSRSHRWLGSIFTDGYSFIQLFEKEAKETLRFNIPLWREYEPECVEVTIEHNLASTFIGFKQMFENVNRTSLETFNPDDTSLVSRLTPIFEQEVVIDFRNNMLHEVHDVEIQALGSSNISWAFLIEESMRINVELIQRQGTKVDFDLNHVIALLDVNELRARFERTELLTRLLTVADAYAADTVFEHSVTDLAGIISRILMANSATLSMITDQLTMRAGALGVNGVISIHCTGFEWLGRAAVVRFGVYTMESALGLSS